MIHEPYHMYPQEYHDYGILDGRRWHTVVRYFLVVDSDDKELFCVPQDTEISYND